MKILKTSYQNIPPYTTKDGSIIRELMHPQVHGNTHQSLAEAIVPIGFTTRYHRHARSEELYHILSGGGEMRLANNIFKVAAGDTICIAPGTPHQITNTGSDELKILCCCVPPYTHADTQLAD